MPPLAPFPTRHALRGMVCSIDGQASSAGIAMLRAGGSAADAAVATNAVLAVTSQHLCGMGGDLFALVHTGAPGPPAALDASGRAGSGADADRLRAEGNDVMPFTDDIRSVPVPGCVDGWLALHERFGRLPLADVLAPAISYAGDGFAASASLALSVRRWADRPIAGDYTLDGSRQLREGDAVRRPGVAVGLTAIVEHGRDGWYRGRFGEELIASGAGEYAEEDLASPLDDWVTPIAARAWDADIWTVPPASQGYLLPASAWIAEGLELGDPDDPRWAHLLIEASRQAACDRLDVLYEGADGAALLDPHRLGPRRAAIGERAASLRGTYRGGGTTALLAADGDGMGVTVIQSNASGFGSGLGVPGLRVFLQNRGYGFSLERDHPAEYGPGRRPPHTLSPALLTTPAGELDTLIATMGGDSQPQILLQLLARHRAGVPLAAPAEAMAAGRFVLRPEEGTAFDTWRQDGDHVIVHVEGHAAPRWAEGLEHRGHRVHVAAPWSSDFGHAHLIDVRTGVLRGVADPRAGSSQAAVL